MYAVPALLQVAYWGVAYCGVVRVPAFWLRLVSHGPLYDRRVASVLGCFTVA